MEDFNSHLQSFIHEETSLNLDKLELVQFSYPYMKVERSGKIKVERSDLVKVVLRYLTELCQGDMLQVDPTLSAQIQENCTMDWL